MKFVYVILLNMLLFIFGSCETEVNGPLPPMVEKKAPLLEQIISLASKPMMVVEYQMYSEQRPISYDELLEQGRATVPGPYTLPWLYFPTENTVRLFINVYCKDESYVYDNGVLQIPGCEPIYIDKNEDGLIYTRQQVGSAVPALNPTESTEYEPDSYIYVVYGAADQESMDRMNCFIPWG